jgi:hypothetical protein
MENLSAAPEVSAHYVCSRPARLFIGESVSLQPVVEGGDSGIERL